MVIREYRGYREEEILPLYEQVGWTSYTARPAMLENAFRHSLKVLAAYEGEMLVGLVRVVGDGYSIVYIQDILVLPDYQRKGIGAALLRRVLEDYRHVYQKILMTDNTEKTIRFYTSAGFTPAPDIGCLSFLKIFGSTPVLVDRSI